MHVLMLCALEVWALPGSGGAPSLARTLQAYGARGHRVTFVGASIGANAYLPEGDLRRAVAQQALDIQGVSFRLVDVPALQKLPLRLPRLLRAADQKLRFAVAFPLLASREARQVLAQDTVDLLYAYEVHGALAARRLRDSWAGPQVARFQGTVLYPALASPFARLRKYEEVRAVRSPADLYIMTDDGTAGDEVLARLNPSSNGKVRFWRNGLDMSRLYPASPDERCAQRERLGISEDAIVMMTASRLVEWKRVDRAIDALSIVRRAVPHALLMIVGDGHERLALEQRARDLGIADALRFTGAVPQGVVADYMRAADIFLAVADLSNVGNPLLEAMACGLAVIAVDAGDTGELIADGVTGRLVGEGTPASVARVIEEVSADAGARASLAVAAREYAERRFWTWEQRMQAELTDVEDLVRASRGATAASASNG